MKLDFDKIRQAYSLENDFPQKWTENDDTIQAVRDVRQGDVSKYTLIHQLMTSLNKSEAVVADERDPLGSTDSVLSVLRAQGVHVDADPAQRAKYMLSSTKFNPKLFLRNVHSQASFEDLRLALDFLKSTIDNQDSSLRNLIDDDYEYYVNTKRQLDDVMAQLAASGVDPQHEWGVQALQRKLDDAAYKYTLVSRPLDNFGGRKTRYQNALHILDAYKQLFNLPTTLEQHIARADHDEFVRDLKRGRDQIAELQASATPEGQQLGAHINQKTTSILHTYRARLWKALMDTPADKDYAQYFARLLDVDADQNPVYEWLDHQADKFHNEVSEFFDTLKLRANLNSLQEHAVGVEVARFIEKAAANEDSPLDDLVDGVRATEAWVGLLDLFAELQRIVGRANVFCRECLVLLTGRRLEPRLRITGKQEATIRNKVLLIFNTTADRLQEFVTAPPPKHMGLPVAAAHAAGAEQRRGTLAGHAAGAEHAFLPPDSNVLSAAKYLCRILDILTPIHDDVLAVLGESKLGVAMAAVKTQFVAVICRCWVRDSLQFGKVQHLQTGPVADLRKVPDYLEVFHDIVLGQLRYIMEPTRGGHTPAATVDTIAAAFPQALAYTCKSIYTALAESEPTTGAGPSHGSLGGSSSLQLRPTPIAQDTKVLVTIRNLDTIRARVLPALLAKYRASFRQESQGIDVQVTPILESLHGNLFDIYSRKKKARISQTITQELTLSANDWMADQLPTTVSSYMLESLMILVEVHSSVSQLSPDITTDVLVQLYQHLLTTFLSSLRELDRLGKYGVLQVVADIEFVRSMMLKLRSDKNQKTIQRIYDTLKEATIDQSLWANSDGPRAFIRPVIESALKREYLAFSCFKTVTPVSA